MPGAWPAPDAAARAALAGVLAGIPDGAVVLLDGLIASAAPEVLVPEAGRLRLVVLVHMPLGDGPPGEVADVRAGSARCCRPRPRSSPPARGPGSWLLDRYALRAEPGPRRRARRRRRRPGAGHAGRRRAALRRGGDAAQGARRAARRAGRRSPTCRGAASASGTLDRDPGFVDRLRRQAAATRHRRPGPLRRPADRRRPRRRVRRRGRAGAGLARRDLRHGRHRGAGARAPGGRHRGRRGAGGPRSRPPTAAGPACWCRRTTRRRSPRRCAAGSATPTCGSGCRRAARQRRATLPGWSDDLAADLAGS